MNILFDLTKARNPYEGITRYIAEVYKRIKTEDVSIRGVSLIAYRDDKNEVSEYYNTLLPELGVSIRRMLLPMRWIVPLVNSEKYHGILSKSKYNEEADVKVFFYNFIPNVKKKAKYALVIHDLTPLSDQSLTEKKRTKIYKQYQFSANCSDIIFTDSQFVKNEIIEKLNVPAEKVVVNYCGVDRNRFKIVIDEEKKGKIKKKYKISSDGYVLFVGQPRENKNLENLLRAYALLPQSIREKHQLVLANYNGKLKQLATDLGIADEAVLLNGIDADALSAVYQMAGCVALLSFSEGFGLPLIEGMSAGVPVIASNVSCLPEIVGEAGIIVDPYNVEAIKYNLERILTDQELRRTLIEKGDERSKVFSWDNTAITFLREIRSLYQNE